MPLSPKKTTIIATILFATTFFYFYDAPDNSQDAKTIESSSTSTKISTPTTPAITRDGDLIKSSSAASQTQEQAHLSQTLESHLQSDSYTYDDPEANTTEEIIAEPEEIDIEEPDPHWAFEKENYYINLFSNVESLAGFILSEAQCENNQCKLSFLLEEEKQKDDITNKLLERLLSESQELSVAFDINTPSDTAVLYISTQEN